MNTSHLDAPSQTNAVLIALVRPLLRFCFRHGVRIGQLFEAIKQSAVQVAREEISASGDKASISRISLMSGVHRKDVTAIVRDTKPPQMNSDVCRRVIGSWRTAKRFTTKNGVPRKLSHKGPDSEFAALVRSVNREVNPYSILYELERVGAITRDGDFAQLLASEYVPIGKLKENFEIVSTDIENLIRAVEENVLHPSTPPHLHLTTSFDNIVPAALPEIRQWLIEQGALLHRQTRNYLSQFDRDLNPTLDCSGGRARVTLGALSFTELKSSELSKPQNTKKEL